MSENQFEGTVRDLKGQAKDTLGGIAGDNKTQAEGKVDQVVGRMQSTYGDVADQVGDTAAALADTIKENPLSSVLIAAAFGYIVGMIRGR